MGLQSQYDNATNQALIGRILIAAVSAATQVAAETPNPTHDVWSKKRADLAFKVLNDPSGNWQKFIYAVVSNVAINPSSTDGDLQFTVNSLWDAMAGVYVSDKS